MRRSVLPTGGCASAGQRGGGAATAAAAEASQPSLPPVPEKSLLPVCYKEDIEARRVTTILFRKLDLDGDGRLCEEEMVKAHIVMASKRGVPGDVLTQREADVEKKCDGVVDESEWHELCGSLYESMGRTQFLLVARNWVIAAFHAAAAAAPSDANLAVQGGPRLPGAGRGDALAGENDAELMNCAVRSCSSPNMVWRRAAIDGKNDAELIGFSARRGQRMTVAGRRDALAGENNTEIMNCLVRSDSSLSMAGRCGALDGGHDAECLTFSSQRGPRIEGRRDALDGDQSRELIRAVLSMHRRETHKQAVEQKEKEGHMAAKSIDQEVTTVTELWETLCSEGGRLKTSVDASDLVVLFFDCKASGLDMMLGKVVPMHLEEELDAVDLSAADVAHLCTLLHADANLSEQEAREAIAPTQSTRGEQACERDSFKSMGIAIGLQRFLKLLSLLSTLMCIDLEYIVLHMHWHLTGCFETTDRFAALVIETCFRKVPAKDAGMKRAQTMSPKLEAGKRRITMAVVSKGSLNTSALMKEIELADFQRLLYQCDAIDSDSGIRYGDISLLFRRILKDIPKRLSARAERFKNRAATTIPTHAKEALLGRSEFEILVEELYSLPIMNRRFPSPLSMLVAWVEKAKAT